MIKYSTLDIGKHRLNQNEITLYTIRMTKIKTTKNDIIDEDIENCSSCSSWVEV